MTKDESYRQKLDDRAKNINYWLVAAGVLTTLVLTKGIALDFITTQRLTEITEAAEEEAARVFRRSAQLDPLLEQVKEETERIRVMSALLASQLPLSSPIRDDWNDTSEMEEFLGYLGYEPFVDTSGANLQDDDDTSIEVSLEVGKEYRFVALCDADCSDLDLMLRRRSDGEAVQTDDLPDALPIVDYSPDASGGEFELVVGMFSCQDLNGCAWRLRGFRADRPQNLDTPGALRQGSPRPPADGWF